jgi:YVTN family beta-propeller protein
MGAGETMRAIMARYNGMKSGERMSVRLAAYPPRLRMGLVEAGAKHTAEKAPDGSWRLEIRAGSRSLSDAPGVHHVTAGRDGSVYAANRRTRVARIDGAACKVAVSREIATGASHMALDERRGLLFVGDAGGNALIAVRAGDLTEVGRWDVPGAPQLPLVTEDGIACITGGSAGIVALVWPMRDGFRAKLVEVGDSPHDPLASPDGQSLYVPCAGDGEVVRLSLADGSITGRFRVGDGPAHLARHPDGSRIYVANTFDGTLVAMSPEGDFLGRAESGGWAHVPEVTPDGRMVYVANFLDDTLSVFDALTLERTATVATDAYPHGLNISHDGKTVVATGFNARHVRVFDAATARERLRIEVGEGSAHTAFSPDGMAAFVGCAVSDHLAVIDLAEGAKTAEIRLN